MCHYPYLAVELDDAAFDAMSVRLGYRRVDEPIVTAAANAGFKLVPLDPADGREFRDYVAREAMLYTTPVGGCGCDWSVGQFEIARQVVLGLLALDEVRAVTWAFLATGIQPHEVNRIATDAVEFGSMPLDRDDCVRVTRATDGDR